MKKNMTIITALTISIMLFSGNGFADIPAPPVNQSIGMPDGILNDLLEADCRVCHDQSGPDNSTNSDRHHLLYDTPLIYGECSVNGNTCLTDADCDTNICENNGNACSDDTECTVNFEETCGEVCVGETAATNPEANTSVYVCVSCHTLPGDDTFFAESDCLVCHYQVDGEASVHHLTGTAQGTDSPLGDPLRGDCTPCHGSLVDDYGDDADIPTYDPSEQTPTVQDGTGEPFNSEGNGAGACDYCHSTGTGSNYVPGVDNATGVFVYSMAKTHHSSGVYRSRTGAINGNNCSLCHSEGHLVLNIRTCEQCHGYESLHSIQADSNGDGEIILGEELDGYGHVGTGEIVEGSDCWGCHGSGVSVAAAPATGPVTPYLSDSDKQVILTGTDTTISLSGSALTNTSRTTEFVSIFTLTAQDGSVIALTPGQINNSSATLTIPGDTPAGNYKLRATKMGNNIFTWTISNPLTISIKNPIVIWAQSVEQSCGECSGELTVWGSGFGTAPPEGSEEFMNVMQNGVPLNITYWKDILIKATGAVCDGSEITINGLFGSATNSQIDYPGDNYCAEYGPCTEGMGDCDSDSECASGLICVNDVGANYGWPSNVDVCEK
jgi:hypothetical protein